MPILTNARHEAFARARAQGAMLDDAYEDAGFAPCRGHGSRLAQQAEIAERIAELRTDEAAFSGASAQGVIIALMALVKDKEISAASVKEARQTLLDAHRIHSELAEARKYERRIVPGAG